MPEAVPVFRWLRVRTLRNAWFRSGRSLWRSLGLLLLVAALWGALFVLFFGAFHALKVQSTEFTRIVVAMLLAAYFFVLLVLLTLTNSLMSFPSMFRSWESQFLAASPLAPTRIFWHKLSDCVIYSMWGAVLLCLPLIYAFGLASGAGASYYLISLVALVAFVQIPVAVGVTAAVLFGRFVLRSRRRLAVIVVAAVAVFGLLAWGEWLRQRREDPAHAITIWLDGPLARLNLTQNPFLPSAWAADCVLNATEGASRACLYPLTLLLVNAAFFTMLAYLVAEWWYARAFLEAQDTRSKRKRHGRRLLVSLIDLFLPAVSRFKRELVLKDLRTFLRSPAQWCQVLIFVGVLAIYFMNVGGIHALGTGVISRNDCSFLNFIAVAMTLCTLTIRFAFPMISLEGQNFWVLGLVPVERYEILEAKFLSILVANLVCGATLTALSDLILRASPIILFLHLVAMVVLSFGLTALSVGLGAIFPSFKEINPAKIASGVGGTINLTLCLGFAASVVILLVLPFHMAEHTTLGWARGLWEHRMTLAFSAVLGTAVLCWGLIYAGARAIESVEQ